MAEVVTGPMEKILNYKFANKNLLVESLTHRSFKDANNLSLCYEKLEVLGDAILDYIINSNVIDFTIFDRYNIKERQTKEFYTNEDFQPFDAHQAKSLLTKNDFLAKLLVLWGIHEHVFFHKKVFATIGTPQSENGGDETKDATWKRRKTQEKEAKVRDVDKFCKYSFIRDFKMNNRDIELFEGPKMLGDVFEGILGAVFIDGGIKAVLSVYHHLLAPFVLHVAKFSKSLYKEPKEDFVILSGINKIKPEFAPRGDYPAKLRFEE